VFELILICYCSFLDEVGTSCEAATEFLVLYKKLFAKDHWMYYLAVKGVPVRIAALITKVSGILIIIIVITNGKGKGKGSV